MFVRGLFVVDIHTHRCKHHHNCFSVFVGECIGFFFRIVFVRSFIQYYVAASRPHELTAVQRTSTQSVGSCCCTMTIFLVNRMIVTARRSADEDYRSSGTSKWDEQSFGCPMGSHETKTILRNADWCSDHLRNYARLSTNPNKQIIKTINALSFWRYIEWHDGT